MEVRVVVLPLVQVQAVGVLVLAPSHQIHVKR